MNTRQLAEILASICVENKEGPVHLLRWDGSVTDGDRCPYSYSHTMIVPIRLATAAVLDPLLYAMVLKMNPQADGVKMHTEGANNFNVLVSDPGIYFQLNSYDLILYVPHSEIKELA